MRNTLEFVALVLLLVLGQFAVEERRRSVGEVLSALGMWALFFGGLVALTFMPTVVALLLRALVFLAGVWLVYWLAERTVATLRGPDLVARLKPRQALEVAREILLDGYKASPAARGEFSRLKPLARQAGDALFLRAAFAAADAAESPADARALCDEVASCLEATRADLEALAAEAQRHTERPLGRWDRRFLAEALLIYDLASLQKMLARGHARLGSRAARQDAAEVLEREAKPSPWREALAAVGVAPPPSGTGRSERRTPRARPSLGKTALALLLPPAGYLAAGARRRAQALGAVWAGLLAYALFALAQGRTVGWIYLATWGLVQILAMFAVYDILAAESEVHSG